MTSFLNKKFGLILLVLATMFIMAVSSVSAADLTINYGDGNNSNDFKYGDNNIAANVTIEFTAAEQALYGTNNATGNLSIWLITAGGPVKVANTTIDIDPTILYEVELNFSTKNVPYLGLSGFYVQYNDNDPVIAVTVDANSWGVSPPDDVLFTVLRGDLTIVWNNPVGLKVGQVANLTGKVYGPNPNNASSTTPYYLKNMTVDIIDVNGNPVTTAYTDENGVFTFEYLIPSLSFNLTANTNISNVSTDINITVNGLNQTYNILFADTSSPNLFTAGLGTIIITQFWWDSTEGYVVGNTSTLYWTIDNYATNSNQDIVAYVVLFDRNNMNKELRRYAVDLYNPANVTGVICDGYLNLSEFILPHIELVAVLVINGFDRNSSQYMYTQSRAENDTFVDASNASRRTTITNVTLPVGGLKVGAILAPIAITVKTFNGSNVQDGFVVVTWDGKYSSEPIPVVSGVALYEHVYELTGSARKMSVQYLGNTNLGGTDGPSPVKTLTVPVLKGTPLVTVVPDTITPFVGDTSTIVAIIDGLVPNGAPATVTFTFTSNGKVVATHTADIKAGLNPGEAIAEITHTFIKTHTLLSIKASIAGNANYNAVTSPVVTLVVV